MSRFLILLFLLACQETYYTPKPFGYHLLEFEPHRYQALKEKHPYTFLVSEYALVQPDRHYLARDHWIEIYYPDHKAVINISYKPVNHSTDSLAHFFETSLRLTQKHHIRASSIDEYTLKTDKGYHAIIHELKGNIPSPMQFIVTDTVAHFLRATLYFPYSDKNDSIAPVIDYLKKDMLKMLHSTEWVD